MGAFIDLTGQKFGKLTVIKRSEKKDKEKEVYWDCICECGKETRIRGTLLRNGNRKDCGCVSKEEKSKKLSLCLKGQTFGRLIVLKKSNRKNYWVCKCQCGNIIETTVGNLRSGHTQSCGCLQKEQSSRASLKDLTGQKFGKLTVLERDFSKNNSGEAYWKCKCDCGNITVVGGYELRSGGTQSCGCLISTKELKISKLLKKYNINFFQQKIFSDLKGIGNGYLRFDFYLPEQNIVIEYQGEQHYFPINKFGGQVSFEKQQIHDNIKRDYCKKNNIKLIEISYKEEDDIENIISSLQEAQ